jgi:hypothetical protein
MPKYVAIIGTKQPFSRKTHPALFQFLDSIPHRVTLSTSVLAFEYPGDVRLAHQAIRDRLWLDDEVVVLEVSAGVWSVGQPVLGAALRDFLGLERAP